MAWRKKKAAFDEVGIEMDMVATLPGGHRLFQCPRCKTVRSTYVMESNIQN